MADLDLLLELQSIHDNLAVIQRDLGAFPPDLAKLDAEIKTLAKRKAELEKALSESKARQAVLSKELASAQKLEDAARNAMKAATQKVQYTAAIREFDERERHRGSIQKPLKELESKAGDMEAQLQAIEERSAEATAQFQELEAIFLSEHATQVEARTRLSARRTELEAALGSSDLARFNRILQQRAGRAVVPVEKDHCGGCRTRIRLPLLSEIREKGQAPCEHCQRILYHPRES